MHRSEFEKFASAIRPRLASRAFAMVGDKAEAEDIVQDCMLKLWTIRQNLDDYTSPEALAMTIVYHLSLNILRDSNRSVALPDDDSLSGVDYSPEELLAERESEAEADLILSKLPDTWQTIIRMRHVEGMSNSEIARTIGSTDGAIRTALSRARCRIAELFTQQNNT